MIQNSIFKTLLVYLYPKNVKNQLNRSGPNFVDNSNDPREGSYDGQRWTICPKKMSTFLSCTNLKKRSSKNDLQRKMAAAERATVNN